MAKVVKKKYVKPKKPIDEALVRDLASIQCTNIEIASILHISIDTLSDRCAEIIKEGREAGKTSLRRAQWQVAMKGNPTMLMFLGKFYLGQKEEIVFNSTEPEVRALLERWNVSATKKTRFDSINSRKESTEVLAPIRRDEPPSSSLASSDDTIVEMIA